MFEQQLQQHLQQHLHTFQQLQSLQTVIAAGAVTVRDACLSGHTVFACGNGGSAADAQHFTAELTGRYVSDRPSYAGVALTVDTSALTAIGNDYGYDCVFSRQLQGLGKANDVLVGISTSGNSQNVIEAVQVARDKGMKIITLLGRDGGKLKALSDTAIVVPSDTTARIQEAHIFILHCFCEGLEP